jgi:hypothetical protein
MQGILSTYRDNSDTVSADVPIALAADASGSFYSGPRGVFPESCADCTTQDGPRVDAALGAGRLGARIDGSVVAEVPTLFPGNLQRRFMTRDGSQLTPNAGAIKPAPGVTGKYQVLDGCDAKVDDESIAFAMTKTVDGIAEVTVTVGSEQCTVQVDLVPPMAPPPAELPQGEPTPPGCQVESIQFVVSPVQSRRCMMRRVIVIVTLFIAIGMTDAKTYPFEDSFRGKEELINAIRITDSDIRRDRLEKILYKLLTDSDYDNYDLASLYIAELVQWFDFTPYEWIGKEEEKAQVHGSRFLALLDLQDLSSMDHDQRVEILRSAIVESKVKLARGSELHRINAISIATYSGIIELQPLVEKYLAEFTDADRAKYSLALSLTVGANDRDDAMLLAAERLQAINACEFRRRMREDKIFFTVALDFTERACLVSPIDGYQIPACHEYYKLFAREWRRGPNGALSSVELDRSFSSSIGHGNWLHYFADMRLGEVEFHYAAHRERKAELEDMIKAKGLSEAEASKVIDPPPCPCELEQAEPDPQRDESPSQPDTGAGRIRPDPSPRGEIGLAGR